MAVVMIATPHGSRVPPEYYRHILEMQAHTLQHTFRHAEIDMMVIGKARNMLVEMALTLPDVDVIWFIDDDTLVPPHAGQLIDQAIEHGIVSGLYFARRPPFTPQAYRKAFESHLEGMYWPLVEYPATGLMVVDAVGGGCLAIRRDVILQMREYFNNRRETALDKIHRYLDGHAEDEFKWLTTYTNALSPWFEFLDRKGEDLYFCERAKDAGHVIWLNLDVKCQHLSLQPVEEAHFAWLVDNNLLQMVPTEGPQGEEMALRLGPADASHEIHMGQPNSLMLTAPLPEDGGAVEDEHIASYFTGPEALERNDNLPRAARRVGV